MKNFPENFELESFFECEPEVLDKDIPWEYNELTFESESENGVLIVKMEMSSELMNIEWHQNNHIVLNLKLKGVYKLQVLNETKLDTLLLEFRNQDTDDLIIKIRPVISVSWGYNDQQY